MSQRERDRLKVLREAGGGHITQAQAGAQLKLSGRWVRKLLGRLRREGDRGVVHRSRGQPSEIVFSQGAPRPQQIAGDKKASVGEHQTPQSRHAPSLQAAELQDNSARPEPQKERSFPHPSRKNKLLKFKRESTLLRRSG